MPDEPPYQPSNVFAHPTRGAPLPLHTGNGNGTSGGMDGRIAHLEERVGRVEDKLDTIIERLAGIATRADMRGYLVAAVAIFVGLMALFVTGMGWLETRATRIAAPPAAAIQPIVIQLPAAKSPAK